jgi:prophage DNA circulation protein
MKLLDIHNPWRDALLPASYKNAEFHVEAISEDNGRRLVLHQYPKKDKPYAEDMGRRALNYTIRGYCVSFMVDTRYSLFQRDYRVARDALRLALDAGGGGRLQLPSLPAVMVACDRYRLTEESRLGGYCVFDMQFVEQGDPAPPPAKSTRQALIDKSTGLTVQVVAGLSQPVSV